MQTIYDWLSLAVFCGLIVLFLQRSTEGGRDKMIAYLPPAIGCAVANYIGNSGSGAGAIAVLVVTVGYIFAVLKPFQR